MPDEPTNEGATGAAPSLSKAERAVLEAALEKEIGPYMDLLMENFDRAIGLVQASKTISDRNTSQDILRAIVVLNHAYLEDLLRTIASKLLPSQDEPALNEIPLAGLNNSGRAEKFFLGKLAHHRGKSVDDVIRESVFGYLERSTFNNVQEIARLLEQLGFDVSKHDSYFPTLEKMMARRHLIVHRADRPSGADTSQPLQSVDEREVIEWLNSTLWFIQSLFAPVFFKTISLQITKNR